MVLGWSLSSCLVIPVTGEDRTKYYSALAERKHLRRPSFTLFVMEKYLSICGAPKIAPRIA
jgi:hypothetical protein